MSDGLIKKAGIEPTSVSDPRTSRTIGISTSVRLEYRTYMETMAEYGRDDLLGLQNRELNALIATDFAGSAGGVIHMFLSKRSTPDNKEWIEIRKVKARKGLQYFFSAIRDSSIDIIYVSSDYKDPMSGHKRVFIPK